MGGDQMITNKELKNFKKLEKEIQTLTDRYVKKIDAILEEKSRELTAV